MDKFFYSYLIQILKKFLDKVIINNFYITLYLRNYSYLSFVLNFLKLHTNLTYSILTDIAAVDFLQVNPLSRFNINYILLSLKNQSRLIVSIDTNETNIIESSMNIYSSANWLEREVWDLLGLFFNNHSDLRRILTDYGFQGYPLRKNFPLNGYLELRYDEDKQYVIYEPLELMQNLRYYNFINPFNKSYIS